MTTVLLEKVVRKQSIMKKKKLKVMRCRCSIQPGKKKFEFVSHFPFGNTIHVKCVID